MKPLNDQSPELQRFIDNNVIYCVSYLIAELVKNETHAEDLTSVLYGDNWEQAAKDDFYNDETFDPKDEDFEGIHGRDYQAYCEEREIEPQQLEFFEHWIVSTYLADKLEAAGEHVVRDFLGIGAIWGRQCTGQSIMLDSVIQQIWHGIKQQAA